MWCFDRVRRVFSSDWVKVDGHLDLHNVVDLVWWGAAPAPRNLVTVGNISRPQRNSLFEYICIRHRSSGNRANPPEIDMRRDRSVSCSSVCTKRFDVHWGCRVLFPLIEMIGRSTRTRESEQKNGLGATAGTKGKWVVMGRRWVGRVGWVVGVGRVGRVGAVSSEKMAGSFLP